MKNTILISLGLLLVLCVGCGYRFEGGGLVNKTLRQVAVSPFENRSSETGAGASFTNALVREIIGKTNTQVVDIKVASAVFHGRIKSISFDVVSRNDAQSTNERRVSAIVDLKLVDASGQTLWAVKDFSTTETYQVNSDNVTDERNKRLAVEKIAERVAEKLVSKTQLNF